MFNPFLYFRRKFNAKVCTLYNSSNEYELRYKKSNSFPSVSIKSPSHPFVTKDKFVYTCVSQMFREYVIEEGRPVSHQYTLGTGVYLTQVRIETGNDWEVSPYDPYGRERKGQGSER